MFVLNRTRSYACGQSEPIEKGRERWRERWKKNKKLTFSAGRRHYIAVSGLSPPSVGGPDMICQRHALCERQTCCRDCKGVVTRFNCTSACADIILFFFTLNYYYYYYIDTRTSRTPPLTSTMHTLVGVYERIYRASFVSSVSAILYTYGCLSHPRTAALYILCAYYILHVRRTQYTHYNTFDYIHGI